MTDTGRTVRAREKAHSYCKEYGGCAQCVLGALQEEFGIGSRESFKAATALVGGIAREGETCGAIVGALSAVGLLIGRERIEDTQASRATLDIAAKVSARFREELKREFALKGEVRSNLCRHIQKLIYGRSFDLRGSVGFQAFLAAGGHSDTGCPKVCAVAAQVAAEEIEKLLEDRHRA